MAPPSGRIHVAALRVAGAAPTVACFPGSPAGSPPSQVASPQHFRILKGRLASLIEAGAQKELARVLNQDVKLSLSVERVKRLDHEQHEFYESIL